METQYKTWVIEKLENLAETFNNNYPEHMQEAIEDERKSYIFIYSLIDKLSKNKCTKEDYENILFHIWQIKYDS